MRFAKGHGTENDFVILPDPDDLASLPAALVVRLCDRHAGLGADGVLRVVRTGTLAAGSITADMGPVTVLGPGSAVSGGTVFDGLRVSVGNPHLACLVDAPLDKFDLSAPPELDPEQFPDGANLELVQLTGPGSLAMRVHERGSGETRSCGTGAVAAAVAAATVAAGQAAALGAGGSTSWQVSVPGGELTVTLDETTAWLTGPGVNVAEGELAPSWLAAGD